MNYRGWSLALVIGLCLAAGLLGFLNGMSDRIEAAGDVLYVAMDGDDGKDCKTVENRCRTIQKAVDEAKFGEEVRVATGVYTSTAVQVALVGKSIILSGGWSDDFLERDIIFYPTVLDGEGKGRVVLITQISTPTIDGFTLTGGNAHSALLAGYGGGIASFDASPIIINNIITGNIARMDPSLVGYGGGIALVRPTATTIISGNLIISNTASTKDIGNGGGIVCKDGVASIISNQIINNSAKRGGGIYVLNCQDVSLDANLIISNTAGAWAATAGKGGGVYIYDSQDITMTNNVVARNKSNVQGGGIYIYYGGPDVYSGKIVNNTITDNYFGDGNQGVWFESHVRYIFDNNIVTGHDVGLEIVNSANIEINYCLFNNSINDISSTGVYTLNNIITYTGPLFVYPAGWNYHIKKDTPARNAINPQHAGWYPPVDIDGDPRPFGGWIDIGADEMPLAEVYLPLIVRGQ
ncbi:MAG: right-handed parallel beta-helix repeat-containing protein [Anaerolineales bacterium]|nr:right-handed parallel beta-helix repeat-containing protein [Anaerolineales bacterium]